MKITKIVPQKFKKEYLTLQLDGEISLKVHRELVYKHGLIEGTDLSDERLSQIKSEELVKEATEYAYLYLGTCPRSEKEMIDRLAHKGFSSETIQIAIGDLKSKKIINDAQYAKDFAEYKIKNSTLAVGGVETELTQKGIPQETIHHTIQNLTIQTSMDEETRAYEILLKRVKQIKTADSRTQYRRFFDYLARRGFPFDTIEKVLARHKRERGFHD